MDDLGEHTDDSHSVGPIPTDADDVHAEWNPESAVRRRTARAEFWLIFSGVMSAAVLVYGVVVWLIWRALKTLW